MSGVACNVSEAAPADWDDYVRAHADAGAFHLAAAVSIGARVFGLRTYHLTVRGEDGRMTGALPLVEQQIVPMTRSLVSLPFCTYGGPIADNDLALAALIDGAETLAVRRGARKIVLRQRRPIPSVCQPVRLDKVSMILDLPDGIDALSHRLGAKLRSQIRRADRVSPEVMFGGADLLDEFYEVFSSVMHELGTPVYPRRFFDAVLRALGDLATVVVVRVDGRPASGAILVRWRQVAEVPWAATKRRYNPVSINMRLYWELLRHSVESKCLRFDFGRSSRDSGTYRFKKQWGAVEDQLYWMSWVPGGGAGAQSLADGGAKREMLMSVWSKLPIRVANWLGPHIAPRLPW